jgi:hypothetical protein
MTLLQMRGKFINKKHLNTLNINYEENYVKLKKNYFRLFNFKLVKFKNDEKILTNRANKLNFTSDKLDHYSD